MYKKSYRLDISYLSHHLISSLTPPPPLLQDNLADYFETLLLDLPVDLPVDLPLDLPVDQLLDLAAVDVYDDFDSLNQKESCTLHTNNSNQM